MTGPEIFDVAEPRPEVLAGTLTDAVLAASLAEVVCGTAPEAYGDPETFFASTHPSAGMRTLLDLALGRLSGAKPDAPPVIRLETNLGGGKTHTLIALYHAARGDLDPTAAAEFTNPANLPKYPIDQIGVLVGTEESATSFPETDGITPSTPWGYLALQLGGKSAYELIQVHDEARTAPGARDLRKIFDGKPSLVLIDELARYLVTARGVVVGQSTLAEQTVAFLVALMEAAASEPNTCVVLTTTETTDPFGGDTETINRAFEEAQDLINRKAILLRPSDEADLPRILARRLFQSVDYNAARYVAEEYARAADDAVMRGTELPQKMTTTSTWQAELERCYPFHPDLIQILDKRLSTIPDFHRTRGALRLLARAIRLLWDAKPPSTLLIHPHHIDLGDPNIAEELSSRLDRPRLEPVIRADIASQPGGAESHAESVDNQIGFPYSKRLATTIYLCSLTSETPGVSSPELIGSVLSPGDDPGIIIKALDQLEQSCWYLHTDVRGYRFSTEASLVKLIEEAERRIPLGKVKQAATDILARQFKDAAFKVKRAWEDPKVPDRSDDAYLVIFHWDELQIEDPEDQPPPKITEIWEKAPAGGNRTYRNRLVFLAPNKDGHEAMIRATRRALALSELVKSDAIADLTPEKRRELKQKERESQLEARIAVCNHVNVIFVPQSGGLEGSRLDLVTQASVKDNHTEAVIERLAAMGKTLAAGDKPLDPNYISSKIGAQLKSGMTTEALVQVFAQRSDLKLVLDKARIRDLIADAVRSGVWDYHDAALGDAGWATQDRPAAAFRIASDTYIYPAGTAPEPKPTECPLCGQVHTGACPGTERQSPPTAPGTSFSSSGAAAVALSTARQHALDSGRGEINRLSIAIEVSGDGTGVELARLLGLIRQQEADLTYRVNATVELDRPDHKLHVDFVGTPGDYQPLKAVLDQVLRARRGVLRASVEAQLDPPWALSGQELEDLHRRATETGPSTCEIEIVTGDSA